MHESRKASARRGAPETSKVSKGREVIARASPEVGCYESRKKRSDTETISPGLDPRQPAGARAEPLV